LKEKFLFLDRKEGDGFPLPNQVRTNSVEIKNGENV